MPVPLSARLLLGGLLLCAAAGATCVSAEENPGAPVASALAPFTDRHAVAGVVAGVYSRTGGQLCLVASGSSDLAAGTAMRTDALFWVASMSKPMTATALMMLVDEDKVHLDDPVERYLPEFRGQQLAVKQDGLVVLKSPAHPITVRNILSHTSGLPFASRVESPAGFKVDIFPLQAQVISYALTPLKTEPDSAYDYSNAGINTAGRIIEVVSGMPYEEFMAARLFRPLGMVDTTLWPDEAQVHRLAKSYRPNQAKDALDEITVDQLSYPLGNHRRGPSPSGGYFSTAADIGRFARMILCGGALDGKRYLSEASLRAMTSTQAGGRLNDPARANGYGLGWSTEAKDTPGIGSAPLAPCGHGGAYATNLRIDPQHGLALIYMVQHAGFILDGAQAHGAFEKAAIAAFAQPAQP